MDRVVDITVSRTNASGDITVPYTTTVSEENIFNFGKIEFADGQTETTLEVTFPNAPEGEQLSFSVQLEDDNAYISHYGSGAISLDFSVLIVTWEYILNPKTNEPALFEVTQNWWGETCWGYVKYYEVNDVRTCFLELNGKHVYDEEYESDSFWGPEGSPTAQLQFKMYPKEKNADGNIYVELLPLECYYHATYDAMIYMLDNYYYWTLYADSVNNHQGALEGLSWLDFAKKYGASNPLGYYDDNGGIFFYAKGRYMYGIGGWTMDTYDIVCIGEGFTRVDYSLGLETDFSQDGVTPIYVEAGADVASLKYAVYAGELNSAQVGDKLDAILAGNEEVETYSDFEYDEDDAVNYGVFGIAPETTGDYTVIVVAYDGKGEAQNNASIVAHHISAADTEQYAVQVSVGAEAVPARYGDYDATSSFAFYVTGTDVTDAKISIYKTKDYEDDATSCEQKTKAGKSVGEDIVSQINVPGGYYAIVDKLSPNTSYTVVVWATNGDADGFATAEYTTDGLPLELLATGDYKYTVAFSNWGTDKGIELYYDPNYDNYVLQNIFYYVDFSFEMDGKGIIHFDPQNTGATYSGTPIYVLESYDYFDEEVIADPDWEIDEEEAADIRKNSYYDSNAEVYNFNMAFVVPGVGSFGHGWETFTVTDDAKAAAAPLFSKSLTFTPKSTKVNSKWQAPVGNIVSVKRELSPIKVSVALPAARKEKAKTGRTLTESIQKR